MIKKDFSTQHFSCVLRCLFYYYVAVLCRNQRLFSLLRFWVSILACHIYCRSGNFRVRKFCVFLFRVIIFLWSTQRHPWKILSWFCIPDLGQAYVRQETNSSLHLWLPCSCWQTIWVWKGTNERINTYCGSKDGRSCNTEKVVNSLPWVTCYYQRSGCLVRNNCR